MTKTKMLFILLLVFGVSWCIMYLIMRAYNHIVQVKLLKDDLSLTLREKVFIFLQQSISNKRQDIINKIHLAGFYDAPWAPFYLYIKLMLSFSLTCIIVIVSYAMGVTNIKHILYFLLFLISLFIIMPDAYLDRRIKSRRKNLSDKLPYVIDLLGLSTKAGLTIETSISYISIEIRDFDTDISYILRTISQRISLVGIIQALEEFSERYPTDEVKRFVYVINQSIHFGTPINELLLSLSREIRTMQTLRLEERVGKLSAKMSVPLILFIMFPIVIMIVAPGLMRMLK